MSVLNIDFNLVTDGETKSCNVPVSEDYMFYAVGALLAAGMGQAHSAIAVVYKLNGYNYV